jgi:hypothetical protein
MLGSEMLDVVIGLVFVYLLLSLICSALKEGLESLLNKRAVDLERGLRTLLNDWEPKGLVFDLLKHPLINGLLPGDEERTTVSTSRRFFSKSPAYIHAHNFALALMDVVRPAKPEQYSGAALASVSAPAGGTSLDTVAAAALPVGGAAAAIPPPNPFQDLRTSINQIKNNEEVKRALLTLVDAAGGDVAKARANIETWFNSAMDRVSGLYKRWTQYVIFALGLLATVAVNADTLAIFKSLSQDRKLRQAVVGAAESRAQEESKKPAAAEKSKPKLGGATDQKPPAEKDVNNAEQMLHGLAPGELDRLRELMAIEGGGLPLGWNLTDSRTIPTHAGAWPMKLLGWLLTTFAISVGAPFWFDVLSKIIQVRAALKPRDQGARPGGQ